MLKKEQKRRKKSTLSIENGKPENEKPDELIETKPMGGTSFSFQTKEFHKEQRGRIGNQLRLIALTKIALAAHLEKDEVGKTVLAEFKAAIKKKEPFEDAYSTAEKTLKDAEKWEELGCFFEFLMMIREKKLFAKQSALVKKRCQELGKWDDIAEELYNRHLDTENFLNLRLVETIRKYKIWMNWLSRLQGMGEHTAALIIGGFESAFKEGKGVEHFETASQMCSFAGLGKPGQRIKKGEKLPYNKQLKSVLLGRWGTNFLIQPPEKSGYRRMYDAEKWKLQQRFPREGIKIVPSSKLPIGPNGKRYEPKGMISEGHIHRMALHNTVQMFVRHLFEEWRKAEGLPSRLPYVFEVLHHPQSSYIAPIVDRPQNI
jgi:hypothetical protein